MNTEVMIGVHLFPEKKDNAAGNCVLWNLLKQKAATRPEIIPVNAFVIFPKAAGTSETSTPFNMATTPELSKVVTMNVTGSPVIV